MNAMMDFIGELPKAELHLHIEGTLEPEMMFEIASRNGVETPYATVGELRAAYDFAGLQDFLDIYYRGADVLRTGQDFFDLTWAYVEKAHRQNVLHAEIFFDPQSHTRRGVPFAEVFEGIHRALREGRERFGISSKVIMCFLRHLDEEGALETLALALPYKDRIAAVGLDSSELGHPPSKFKRLFASARKEGFLTVAHAGEVGPCEYVWEALDDLRVSRIDHGNRSLDDEALVKRLAETKTPLTVCPLSNLRLRVVKDMKDHPLRKMMDKGLMVTVNSDDPAYFGGYINENFLAVQEALNLSRDELASIARNSFEASFLDAREKERLINKVDEYAGHQ